MTRVRVNRWLKFLIICFPPLIVLFFISNYAVNIPYMDHWDGFLNILNATENGSLEFSHLWEQHNEHRLIFPKIIMLLLASVSHWNVIWEQYFSLFIQACTLFLILQIWNKSLQPERDSLNSLFQVFTSILLFSMVQYENWSWGWQIQIFLNVSAVCFTMWAIIKWPNNWFGLILALVGATVATYSFANGMLIWGIVLLWFVFFKFRHKISFILIWLSVASVIFLSYIYHYEKPAHHPDLLEFLEHPLYFLIFFLSYIGSPFGIFFGQKGSILFGVFGICTFLFLVFSMYSYKHRDLLQRSFPWFGLILYVLLSAMITAAGRSGFSSLQALSSRYTTFSLIFWISLFAIALPYVRMLYGPNKSTPPRLALTIGAVLFSFLVISHSLSYSRGVIVFKNHFTKLSHIHSLLGYEKLYGANNHFDVLFPSRNQLYSAIKNLRQIKMGPFYNEITNPNGVYIACGPLARSRTNNTNVIVKDDSLILLKNTQLSLEIEIPKSGDYAFLTELGVGPNYGFVSFKIDEIAVNEADCRKSLAGKNNRAFEWINCGKISLSKGLHTIRIKGRRGRIIIRTITFRESKS